MKTPQQEITEMLLSNAGNRLTNELIAGMQARLYKIFEQHSTSQQQSTKEKE
ncbi:hypothetical protein ABXZ88_003026 [Vibrio fluvialis]